MAEGQRLNQIDGSAVDLGVEDVEDDNTNTTNTEHFENLSLVAQNVRIQTKIYHLSPFASLNNKRNI